MRAAGVMRFVIFGAVGFGIGGLSLELVGRWRLSHVEPLRCCLFFRGRSGERRSERHSDTQRIPGWPKGQDQGSDEPRAELGSPRSLSLETTRRASRRRLRDATTHGQWRKLA